MNMYEAGLVNSIMMDAGYIPVDNENDADIIFLITCAVREHAEKRALGRYHFLRRLKKNNPHLILGILGCMAQSQQEQLIKSHSVDIVAGPDEYRKLPLLIRNYQNTHTAQFATSFSDENYEGILSYPQNHVNGFISIMRGCNNFCSYCIVPYVRGRERSKSLKQILKEVEFLIQQGIQDITLIGQNVLAWHDQDLDFLSLLKIVNEIEGYQRLRFITSHPKDLTERYIQGFTEIDKLCLQLHLPFQSGSDRILKLMNRGYTKQSYLNTIAMLRKVIPQISLTTDVLVGFPTETDTDFQDTLDVIKQVEFDFAYMFRYSERPYTKAREIFPKVDDKISKERLLQLIELQNKITEKKSREFLNKKVEILIESNNHNQSFGRTRNNKIVIIKQTLNLGKIYYCQIKDVVGWTPIGEIINNKEAE